MLNKTIKGSDFDNIFTEVIHSESLGLINPEQLRLFHLNVMNNEFVSDDLQAFIRKNVGRYVFSRAKLEQFKINDDLESIGLEAMAVMQKNGRPGQQNTGNSLGEILLYAFLEQILDAPKIMSKVELFSTTNIQSSKCDGIHLLSLGGYGQPYYQLVFGSSSVVGDMRDAIDQAFDAIMDIEQTNKNRLQLLEPSSLDRDFDPETARQIKEVGFPKKGSSVVRDTAYGVFIGYTLGLNPASYSTMQYQNALNHKMNTDIKNHAAYIARQINSRGLGTHSFYFYILPLNDADKDKSDIMEKAMRGGVMP